MSIRIDHVFVALGVSIVLVFSMYLFNIVFTDHYNADVHRFDSKFNEMELEMERRNYQQVLIFSNQIIKDDETGINEIRARVFQCLANLHLGETAEATHSLEYLINKYPGLKIVYEAEPQIASKEQVESVCLSILSEYIPGYNGAVNEETTFLDFISAMDMWDWLLFIGIMIGSVRIYERILTKRRTSVSLKH